jgi:hypothetical protein
MVEQGFQVIEGIGIVLFDGLSGSFDQIVQEHLAEEFGPEG